MIFGINNTDSLPTWSKKRNHGLIYYKDVSLHTILYIKCSKKKKNHSIATDIVNGTETYPGTKVYFVLSKSGSSSVTRLVFSLLSEVRQSTAVPHLSVSPTHLAFKK